jgi:saccharopine dehydrogenase-like NADP-dependent oxidoreductase
MKRILVFGAGRSAYYTIKYLLQNAVQKQWNITIADGMRENLDTVAMEFPGANVIVTDVQDDTARRQLIHRQDIVISLLPAVFHILVSRDCLEGGIHLVTPSYITPEIAALHDEAKGKRIVILNEIGLDPGIDHMSSMHIIHRLKEEGATINSYKSYCGGLIPANDSDNPFRYKLSWNPYNVIRAGQSGGLSLLKNKFHYVPYHRLFNEVQVVEADGEAFESYFNRDSMHYISLYELEEAGTFLRGTLRYPGFCKKWNALVQVGLTTDAVTIDIPGNTSWMNYIQGFLPEFHKTNLDVFMDHDTEILNALHWLFDNAGIVELNHATPAQNLQKLLEMKWKMNPLDKDRVVMVHEFEYLKGNKAHTLKSWMDIEGEDSKRTAMAKTVGLPLAIAAELIADDKIHSFGVILPTIKEVYAPMLRALEKEGIGFKEKEN